MYKVYFDGVPSVLVEKQEQNTIKFWWWLA